MLLFYRLKNHHFVSFDVNAYEFWFRAWWILLISHRCLFIVDIIKLCDFRTSNASQTNQFQTLPGSFLYGINTKFILFNRICRNLFFFLHETLVGINVINPSFIYLLEKFNRFVLEAIRILYIENVDFIYLFTVIIWFIVALFSSSYVVNYSIVKLWTHELCGQHKR